MAERLAAIKYSQPHNWPRRPILIWSALFLSVLLISSWLVYRLVDRTPGELLRYIERRINGHPKLEIVTFPIIGWLRTQIERPIPNQLLPTLGKGQQAYALSQQHYNQKGEPIPTPTPRAEAHQHHSVSLATETDILSAISKAKPGDSLSIAPGTYKFGNNLYLKNVGSPENPIVIGARVPGKVIFEFSAQEGFVVEAPYWVIENLTIRGVCKADEDCEHAFHVFGKAHGTVIRNNRIEDFNAQIKVNGYLGNWPDSGLIQFNTIRNTRARRTHHPVTLIDIVGANHWQITDNLVSNFIKGQGNQISYGLFIKGGASDGRIERNLVICTETDVSQQGSRVGISFGGGGTDKAFCRDKRCITEHTNGIIANNIVAHCNDFGIYINRSNQSEITHNTLVNTYGIDVRFAESSATTYGNLFDGQIRSREGGIISSQYDQLFWRPNIYEQADRLDFGWNDNANPIPPYEKIDHDRCKPSLEARKQSRPGAIQFDFIHSPNC
jgi:parallel beta-helix repeat protein